jgi:hypothetical protein
MKYSVIRTDCKSAKCGKQWRKNGTLKDQFSLSAVVVTTSQTNLINNEQRVSTLIVSSYQIYELHDYN